jgi:thioredoxin 2
LPPLAEPLDVDAHQLRDIAGAARVPILVDFWATWCAPCRMSAPEVARVARDMAGRALVLKVDTERHPDLAAAYEIRAVPTFVVLKNGAVSFRQSGLARSPQMQAWLDSPGPV